jgi:hypothetical protein
MVKNRPEVESAVSATDFSAAAGQVSQAIQCETGGRISQLEVVFEHGAIVLLGQAASEFDRQLAVRTCQNLIGDTHPVIDHFNLP